MNVSHRRSRRLSLGQLLAPGHSIPGPQDPAADVLHDQQMHAYTSPPSYIAQGSRMRAMRCLVCGHPLGGECVRLTALVLSQPRPSHPQGLVSRAYFTHAVHWPMDETVLHKMAHILENPHCTCAWHQ